MNGVVEIETALRQLSEQDKWQVARWLLEDLEKNGQGQVSERPSLAPVPLPDYAARRRRIFGDKVLPNLVLIAFYPSITHGIFVKMLSYQRFCRGYCFTIVAIQHTVLS